MKLDIEAYTTASALKTKTWHFQMPHNIPRHRLRYSLAALFGVLTVFCGWLGKEMNRIHDRREATKELIARGMSISEEIDAGVFTRKAFIPAYRRWLGDAAVGEIHTTGKFNIEEKYRLQYLFPEADIIEWGDFRGRE